MRVVRTSVYVTLFSRNDWLSVGQQWLEHAFEGSNPCPTSEYWQLFEDLVGDVIDKNCFEK